jgi:5-formyltetrahydrofolate cyclo-ligase
MSNPAAEPATRRVLRERLIAARQGWLAGAPGAQAAIGAALRDVLRQLEPSVLGTYWPIRCEFNPSGVLFADKGRAVLTLALPYARKQPREMEYRLWDRREPSLRDECGIPAADGAAVVPDVVLVPCVGYTADGLRLGYGGGYFDRWLAQHAGVTSVGVAWSAGELGRDEFAAEPHDRPLDLIVTDRGVR